MNSTELRNAFRQDVMDTAKPYLWSDEEVWRYANDAYRMFARLTGGVADFLSDACEVQISAGEAVAEVSPSIMRIMSATRRSDTHPIEIINPTDLQKMRSSDYGQIKQIVMDERTGPVRYMIIGLTRGSVRWVQVPEVDDYVDMHIYRMPLDTITGPDQELTDVAEDHHIHLLDWMKHLAYKKSDADTFNPQASVFGEQEFRAYCLQVVAEWERYKHKTRVVSYGGI